MKKAFSLIEVLIAVTILSIVMVTLLQVKSDNIFLVNKADEKVKLNDYILLSQDLNQANDRNENIFLDRIYSFDNDKIRREFKSIKIKIKDKEEDNLKVEEFEDLNLDLTTYSTSYSIDGKIKKNIYTLKIEL